MNEKCLNFLEDLSMVAIETGATYSLEEFMQCHMAKMGLVRAYE